MGQLEEKRHIFLEDRISTGEFRILLKSDPRKSEITSYIFIEMIFQRLDDVGNTDNDGDDDECYNCKSSKCMTAPTPLGSIVCRVRKELFV